MKRIIELSRTPINFKQFLVRFSLFAIAALAGAVSNISAQAPNTLWTRTFNGNLSESDAAYSVQQTSDGGFIIAGYTDSYLDPNFVLRSDLWLIRTDESGNALWTRNYGGSEYEIGRSVQQTADGGFVVVGETRSFGAGSADVWLIRTDDSGNILWTKTFGDTDFETGHLIQQTTDGGFIIVGYTSISGAPYGDALLIRTDSLGVTLWTKTFGGSGYDIGNSVQQTADGGFIITGATQGDLWLIRTDSLGVTDWTLTYDVAGYNDFGNSVRQTSDGGFIVAGDFFSETAGGTDILLLRTDDAGNILWTDFYGDGSVGTELGNSVQETADGGFIVAGQTSTFSAGQNDLWIIRTDDAGMTLWTQSFGGSENESGHSVRQTTDGGFIISGYTNSFGASSTDVWLIRLDSEGPTGVTDQPVHGAPQTFVLAQNYPNPFNPITNIEYHVESSDFVTVKVYDLLGREIATLVNENLAPGRYRVQWDGRNRLGQQVSSGVYLYRLVAGGNVQTRQMLLVQ